ncbi:hypothetical protein J437_LFUL006827 [Ladona fulva]|uniref:Mitochondrial ribonuclease P catalytic subunit n=1 Tax=Ladona fulva TaxID=123851 RepID=A0A8K0K168_LADFU|nr:hypothetical protein J437_LFUL006827 [Ladona fulva]
MMAFSVRTVIRRFNCRILEFSFRKITKYSFITNKLSRSSVFSRHFCVPATTRPLPSSDAGFEHEEIDEETIYSDEESFSGRKPTQLNLIYETLVKHPPQSEEEVYNFREKVINSGHVVTKNNVDSIILGICSALKNINFADSYLNMLKSKNIEINVAAAGRYLRVCYACNHVRGENKILEICSYIRNKMPLMDATTAENVLHGLSLTSEWRQGLELLDMIKETCTPTGSTYSSLVIAAFRNDDQELGWEIMEECIKIGKVVQDTVYLSLLDLAIAKNRSGNKQLAFVEKILEFLKLHELRPSTAVAKKLKYTFETMNWKGYFTSISDRGCCNICKAEIPPILISKTEFQELSTAFLEKVLVGPDVFSKSSPEEVKAFQDLMANEAPFNTVIDGLNIAYSTGGNKVSVQKRARTLQAVVAHFVDLSHKILVLGRTHMNSWPRYEMEYVRKNSQLFLTENLSQDDPFLLYAAMSSGPATCFISKDFMRSHAHRLKLAMPSLSSIFKRWQISHQIRLVTVLPNGRVILKYPLDYSPNIQKVQSNWHIPYQSQESDNVVKEGDNKVPILTQSHLDPPSHWLCLSEKKYEENYRKPFGRNDEYNRNVWRRREEPGGMSYNLYGLSSWMKFKNIVLSLQEFPFTKQTSSNSKCYLEI